MKQPIFIYKVRFGCLLFLISGIFFTSCIPNHKIIYLQSAETETIPHDSLISLTYPNYQLQVGDILNIDVRSSDSNIAQIFQSSGGVGNQGQLVQNASDINYLTGFTIDLHGNIELPLVGKINVADRSVAESKELIAAEIRKYITDAFIQVRLGGIRYTALGEFNRPGRYSVLQSQLTIFEAIANAGDLTVLANRKEALLIRQYPDGVKTHKINLTKRDLMTSDFYFIRPNDQLYLEPLPVRQFGGNVGVTGFQSFTAVLSAASSVLLIIVTLNNLN